LPLARRGQAGDRHDRPEKQAGPIARAIARIVVGAADAATRWVTRLLGASATAGRHSFTEAELRDLIAGNLGIDGEERRIIEEVLAAGARHVREVMVPRLDVVFLEATCPVAEAVRIAAETPHSRFPVINGSHDDVVGFVHLRDLLLPAASPTAARVTVADLAREVHRLPGPKRVLAALSEMRRERHHLAVVVDEYGGTAGIVTLEDLIEELVGEIHDEYDVAPDPETPPGVPPTDLDGRTNLPDFAERCGFALPSGPYETLGGFVMARLGRVATPGDEVRIGPWRLVVTACDGRRVSRVAIAPS
jgi:putative hemolysin